MKFNFRKISAIGASVLMVGMTAGIAAAATYPAPFVNNGVANAAIVYGTGPGVSQLDFVDAQNIQTNLLGSVTATGSTTTTINGEHVDLERPSSLLHVGGYVGNVFGRSITADDMENLLKNGVFRDSSNDDHDYTQKINVANLSLSQFDLSDYDSNVTETTPTIGIPIDSDAEVLNYTLTFQDNVNMSHMNYEDLNMLGKNYYVLSASNGTGSVSPTMTLLDSGTSASLSQGDSKTLVVGNKTYDVSATYVDAQGNVKLKVGDETTDTLRRGDTYKLSDGTYVGIKNVIAQGYQTGLSYVDFSIGSGKIELTDGNNVQVNSNSVNGLIPHFTIDSNDKLSKLVLTWTASDDVAITSSGLTMPVFDGISLAFGGMNYPTDEMTKVKPDGNNAIKISTTIKNGPVDVDILANNNSQTNFTMIGKDSTHLLETGDNSSTLNYNGTKSGNSFVASYNGGTYAESYLLSVDNFVYDSDENTSLATINSKDGGSLNQQVRSGDDVNLGDIVLHVDSVNKTTKMITFTGNSGTSFNTLYTAEGLKILLPTDTNSSVIAGGIMDASGNYLTSYPIQFTEEDKDGNIGSDGVQFNVTVDADTNYKTTVDGVSGLSTGIEEGTTSVYDYVASSALATSVKWDKSSSTQQDATIDYHGDESYGTLSIASSDAISSSTSGASTGSMLVLDTEVSSVSDKNLIVVGGSCINSAAAALVGEAACGESFTGLTNVAKGQFLIKGYANSSIAPNKLAVLVAGYDATDTQNAATYLTTQTVDTSSAYIGTSGSSAEVQVTTA